MADTTTSAGGRPPGNGNTYNPVAGATYLPGTPVCQSQDEDGTVVPAQGDDEDDAFVVGLSAGTGVAGNHVLTQFSGPLRLTAAEWHAVGATSGGLVRGTVYYLSTQTPGNITATKPTSDGTFATALGVAMSATDLMVQISSPTDNGGT